MGRLGCSSERGFWVSGLDGGVCCASSAPHSRATENSTASMLRINFPSVCLIGAQRIAQYRCHFSLAGWAVILIRTTDSNLVASEYHDSTRLFCTGDPLFRPWSSLYESESRSNPAEDRRRNRCHQTGHQSGRAGRKGRAQQQENR